MLAYNKTQLDHLEVVAATEQAFKQQLITAEEKDAIIAAHPVAFYTPNFFVRLGIFILTAIIVGFSLGLFTLMMVHGGSDNAFGGLLVFFGVISYVGAELLIREKHHYKSGADDALIYCSGICIVSAFIMFNHGGDSERGIAVIVTMLGAYFSLRFADMLATAAAFAGVIFLLFSFSSSPWLIMAASLGIYLAACNLKNKYYENNAMVLQSLSLLTLYAAGNYFIVREVTEQSQQIFWVSTVLIPLVYLFFGIYRKNRTLLRSGLVLVAAMVFTIRYYHSIAPLEVAMTLAGVAMILIAYILIRYLKTPKNGFTSEEVDEDQAAAVQLESLIIAQTFNKVGAPPKDGFEFGGGDGGGGGASGGY
ncbi:hypothetical protein SAMN05444266_102463 [Chitinophaga jiangningensis]|uniref:DUF2157 domain-containing protein n=1 Tax=Chitinophaga jiangningensis TaxID=1419482 RepID=A0A1M6YST0_9BACT|nr:hypothetical protein [Chitinophaga jiangningensis]SHL21143.1 hypothetical protein SAMN05444266_102463 [Chitinophaga jiangningensis]